MPRDRRSGAAVAIRELDVEIDILRGDLACLERARDILERLATEHPDRCDVYHPESHCEGVKHARWCRRCGQVFTRCEGHGGLRAANHDADLHRADQHGGQDAYRAETYDAGRVPRRGTAVSLGRVQTSPAAGGGEGEATGEPSSSTDLVAPQPGEPGSDKPRPSTGPSVIRRRARGETVD